MIEFLCTLAGLIAGIAFTASLISTHHDEAEVELEELRKRVGSNGSSSRPEKNHSEVGVADDPPSSVQGDPTE